ncbi:Uncharacterised protein [Mycobacteroides abscessus subsp. abscessus]|nr:Uncharacterised protein [Mycobacteroides abscessus subsp. abscessus]SLH39451.1 Uncharacterised protein [Mycobacteroides abscessus subsp. abscessus]
MRSVLKVVILVAVAAALFWVASHLMPTLYKGGLVSTGPISPHVLEVSWHF